MKKGRHRRFEEARKLKQAGPEAFGGPAPRQYAPVSEEDEYEAIAKRYGAFDDEDDEGDEDDR